MTREIQKITVSTDFVEFHYEFHLNNCNKFINNNYSKKLQEKIYNDFKSKIEYRIFDKVMEA